MFFQLTMMGARENETLILMHALGHYRHLFQLCLPKKFACFFSLGFKRS
jgi:hypothetical protein